MQREQPNLVDQDIRVTVLHTSDIHSRLFPYRFVPGRIDQNYGLLSDEGPYGGIARIAAIAKAERAKAARSLWLDSGDCFQGAPVFNIYRGEAELRALSEAGLDGAVIGNHEFDLGSNNLYEQIVNWASFPLLAANYVFDDPALPNRPKLRDVVPPYQIYDLDGVRVGVIGMANYSSMTGIFEGGNSLGIRPLDTGQTVEFYVKLLRPAVDLVVLVSHLGLDEDEGLTASEVSDENELLLEGCGTAAAPRSCLDGVDLILGGHLHIVLNPPKILQTDAFGNPTVLVHSGAFAKYIGRLDLVVHMGSNNADPAKRSHITAFSYDNLAVSCGPRDTSGECLDGKTSSCPAADALHPNGFECVGTTCIEPCPHPEDPDIVALLQPYSIQLNQLLDLGGVFAYVNAAGGAKIVRNDASGGDSQLGNLVARAMQKRPGVDADFAITNSLGIRADFEQGPLTLEDLYNVFPFENSITIMFLSGNEVRETLDFVASKSSERGCRAQAQMAGITFTMVCGASPHADDIYIGENCRTPEGAIDPAAGCLPLEDQGLYRVAVNDYIAAGGSGFTVLKRNTSKQNTGISLRAALQDYIRGLAPCGPTVLDDTDPTRRSVVKNYGAVTCLDEMVEQHDNRIYPTFQ